MGSSWSSASENPSSESDVPSISGPWPNDTSIPNDSTAGSQSSRKRKRPGEEATDIARDSRAHTSYLREKKRRISESGIGLWSSKTLSYAWNSFADSASRYCAKAFLYAAEVAAKSAKPGELADEEDFLNGLLQSLDCFQSTDMDILRRGWRVLSVCSKNCDASRMHLLFEEAQSLKTDLLAILTAMEGNCHQIKIQLLGFRALKTLVNANGEQWHLLVDEGAIPVFTHAMRIHSNDVVIQGLGITFLAMVVQEVNSIPREQVVNMGGIQLVIQAMRNFQDDPRLLHTACYALHQFGFTRRIREMVVALDGGKLFLEAIDNHIDDSALVDLCLSALGKLSDAWPLNWETVSPLILKTMERWPKSSSIQGHCLVLLIRATGQTSDSSIDAAIRQSVRVMKNFPSTPSLQFFACAVLREILERMPTASVRNRVLEEGAMEYVVKALMNHRDAYGLQPMGLLAIMNVWERQTLLERAATTAFGGNELAIAAITGVQIELVNEVAH